MCGDTIRNVNGVDQLYCLVTKAQGVNNLPKVAAQQCSAAVESATYESQVWRCTRFATTPINLGLLYPLCIHVSTSFFPPKLYSYQKQNW